MNRHLLLKILVASTVLVSACTFLGPYDYQFGSIPGLQYYYGSIIMFALPLAFTREGQGKPQARRVSSAYSLTSHSEQVIALVAALAILAALAFSVECVRLFGIDALLQGGDFRNDFSVQRSSVSKVAELIACLGPASFLLVSAAYSVSRSTRNLSYVALMSMGMTGLLLGARWKLFVCVLVLVFASVLRQEQRSEVATTKRATHGRFILATFLAAVSYAFFSLFAVRGLLAADEQFRFYPGDMPLKPWATALYQATNGAIQPLYRLIDYIGQAPFVFSTLFVEYLPTTLFFGAFLARPAGYVLPNLGLPFPSHSEIVNLTFTGMYSGTAYGLIIDFGVIGGLLASFLAGCTFGMIERRRSCSKFARIVLPIICTMTACFPVYYFFHVGYVDYVICWLALVIFAISLLGGMREPQVEVVDR